MKVLIIVPCYNESASILSVVNAICSLDCKIDCKVDCIVINDSSTDGSKQVLTCNKIDFLELPVNLGIGGAVQTGLLYAHEKNYDLAIQIDGDGQHPPTQIPALLTAYLNSRASLVIGSRYMQLRSYRSTYLRRTGSAILSALLWLLYSRIVITDPTSGMRLFDSTAIRLFKDDYPSDYPEPITNAIAIRAGLQLVEVPVEMCQRQYGISSISTINGFRYMLRVVSIIFFTRFKSFPLLQSNQ